ncbi:DUF2197 domain-containing protein [Pseudalkalibacillus caeni]|uniref:DUF2197 domain-containing protein n=1 Tax=Exobacillus caeni TaxID=2574798 RepID=A0A5R9F5F1_9BACL|nr:DUF2197 domain-containing protein [Pseudalkalibacillus caeni]TLS38747.1 DUF2197 domain-containing protein [Pseudalkalibacillus caeni]
MKKNCLFCKKEFEVKPGDPQYRKLLANKAKSYVCKRCNQSLQTEASAATGLHPDQIDEHDKFLK